MQVRVGRDVANGAIVGGVEVDGEDGATILGRDVLQHARDLLFGRLGHTRSRATREHRSAHRHGRAQRARDARHRREHRHVRRAPRLRAAGARHREEREHADPRHDDGACLHQARDAHAHGRRRVGERVADRVLAGAPVPPSLKLQFALARRLALDNVRKLIGIHRARFCVTGAAPISPDLVRWYLALGVPMIEVWGMTESCGASTYTSATRIKPGMIGPACPYNEVRLDPETGELLIRGKNVFMGYLNQPEKTAETIDADGWLHTGDVGTQDGDGYFRITDRMKDIIITAGGKNITPSELENELKFSPYITDAVVIGDRRPFLTAIVMIDLENVEKFAQDHDVPFSNYASLARAPEVQALIEGEIARVNAKFARVEQIKKFWLLETQLSAEDEELTPTMKLKRKLVENKYGDRIEAMYGA